MTEDELPTTPSNPESRLTRRRMPAATGTGALMLLVVPRALGHDDHDDEDHDDEDDDSGRGRGRGRGGDDEAVRPAGEVPAGSVEVQIVDDDADGFQPGTITIDVGQSVTWVNLDDDDHTATSSGFDTGIIRPGELATITFSEPSSFVYSCQIHPEMVGRVEVLGADGTIAASPSASPEGSPQATPLASLIASVSVAMVDIAFNPPQLEISVGTTVTWTNQDPVPHSATATEGAFDSGILDEGGTFAHTFDAPGTFEYICVVHPSMKASVTVIN